MNTHVMPSDLALAPDAPPKTDHRRRKLLFGGMACAVVAAGAAGYAWQSLVTSRHVVTDNAYVDADTAQVTALTAGPVAQVRVIDTQRVHRGDVLVVLDGTDRRLEMEQAQAALAQVERQIRGFQANNLALAGQIAARQAEVERARTDLDHAQVEFDRRAPLAGSGAVSGEEVTAARSALRAAKAAYDQARANLDAARGAHQANDVLISGASLDENPQVRAARFRLDQARVALERTVVRSPVDGVVTQRQVQVGQMVAPGTQLMTVVPVQQAFVNANFKEVQLARVRPGQSVTLKSDLYGEAVTFHGRVQGVSGGTGAALSIVPAQNATGNWIKVVQRLPVRIALDPRELDAHPLKIGLSMTADIQVDR